MKLPIKAIILALLMTLLFNNANAQKIPTENEFMRGKVMVGHTLIDTANATPQQMAFYRKQLRLEKLSDDHYFFNWLGKQNIGICFQANHKGNIYEGLKQVNNGQEYTSVIIDGTTSVEMIAQNIDSKHKANNYLYRVIRNNRQEVIGWTRPSDIRASTDGTVKYAYLGRFDYSPGQFLKLEIYNIKNFSEQDAILIDWRPVEAAKVDGEIQYIDSKFSRFGDALYSKNINDLQQTTEKYFKYVNRKGVVSERPVTVKDFIETISKNDIRFRADDSLQNLTFHISNGLRIYNYKVSLRREVEGHTDSIDLGDNNDVVVIYREFWKKPGKYKLTFTPKIYKHGGNPLKLLHNKATTISFTVLPSLNQQITVSLKFFGLVIIIIVSTGGFMFLLYRRGQQRKLKKAAQNRQIATLQLQAVRSQLNPHFIFNALAGIQNLMNKNQVENANKYLSKFAKLTRKVLDESNNELTSVEAEIELVTDYLTMEQMRFGFRFNIKADANEIDHQLEIPAMLLQPFVENAVKHGVSALGTSGIIEVIITKTAGSLALMVKDNGKGFSNAVTSGMGLKLCRERIALLNSIYKASFIKLHQLTDDTGTLITIELQNWI
jgi:two-component system LytT family sensor kinase